MSFYLHFRLFTLYGFIGGTVHLFIKNTLTIKTKFNEHSTENIIQYFV